MPTPSVLYVGGWGRSGTTVVDRVLGSYPGVFSAGELGYLWERGLIDHRRCGCGRPVPECPVWTDVLAEAFGAAGPPAPNDVLELRRRGLRIRHTPALVAKGARALQEPDFRSYADILRRLYQAIATVTGASVIVDSTKRPPDALVLTQIDGIKPYLVHMTRDPRAVAFSWQRHRAQNDPAAGKELIRIGALESTRGWLGWNTALELVGRRFPAASRMLLRYEDFAAEPRAVSTSLAQMVGLPADGPFLSEHRAELTENHTVAGNPMRFKTGAIDIRPDLEWVGGLSAADRRLIVGLAGPLMLRYGYPLRENDIRD